MRRIAFTFFAFALLALAVPADAGWSQSGQGQSGTGGITLPAGDLSGTGSSNATPTISNLTGSAGTLTLGSSLTTASESGTGPANGTANGFALTTQAVNATNGNAGNVAFNMPVPTGSGSHGTLQMQEGGTAYSYFGRNPTGGTQGWMWLGSAAPSLTNYTIVSDGASTTFFNGVTGMSFSINNSTFDLAANASGLQLLSNTFSLGGGTAVVGIANASVAPTSNPSGGGILYESGGGHFHRGSGGAIAQIAPAGVGTINTQTMKVTAGELYAMRTTSNTTTTWATIAVAASTCHQFSVMWQLRTATGTAEAFDETVCSSCNTAGTVTTSTALNKFAVQLIGTPCSVAPPSVTCVTSGTNVLLQGLCNTGTVDWQLYLTDNLD